MAGSGILSKQFPTYPERNDEGKSGFQGFAGKLLNDLYNVFMPQVAHTVEEFDAPVAAATNALMAAAATSTSVTTVARTSLTSATLTSMATCPRQFSVTTGGSTPGHAPARVTVHGVDPRGVRHIETVNTRQTAGTVYTNTFWTDILNVVESEGGGTDATVAFGVGAKLGLSRKPKTRAGWVALTREMVGSTGGAAVAAVTPGTLVDNTTGTAATVTGTGDLTNVTTLGNIVGQTIRLAVDEATPVTATITGSMTKATVVSQANTALGASIATAGGSGSKFLVLTSTTTGTSSEINITGGTALTLLGLAVSDTLGSAGVAAAITGTGDLTVAATLKSLVGKTLLVAVDGASTPTTITFAAVTTTLADIAGYINTAVGAVVAAAGGGSNKYIVLTSTTTGINSTINVLSGTALTNLGLSADFITGQGSGQYGAYTPNTAADGSHNYVIYYEYDPSV